MIPAPYVLIVEDDPDIRRLLVLRLKRAGADVYGASTGEEGLTATAARVPALVLLDLHLPGIDGWEVITRLAAADRTARTPILIVSIEDAPRSESPSVRGWLVKPFQGRDIDDAIRRILPLPGHAA